MEEENGYYDKSKDKFGFPQKYLDFEIYPIKMIDEKIQDIFYEIMAYPKNHIPDKQILKMSYLKYLLMIVQQSGGFREDEILNKLLKLLRYVFKEEDLTIKYKYKKEVIESFDDFDIVIFIKDKQLSEFDFDIVRAIILRQNGLSIEFVNQYVPELEKRLQMLNKGKKEQYDRETQFFTFLSLSGLTPNETLDLTVYQFKRFLERLIMVKEYDVYKPLEASGQVTAKGGEVIKHYTTKTEDTGRYDSILIKKEKFIDENEAMKVSSIKNK